MMLGSYLRTFTWMMTFAPCYSRGVGGVLGYWGIVVLCGLHYLLEYWDVIEADTSLEFHDGQAFA